MREPLLGQHASPVRLEWGRRGAMAAAHRGDHLVVVDTLRFSTAVVTALAYGTRITPCPEGEDPTRLADRLGAVAAARGLVLPPPGNFSLSPQTYLAAPPGTHVVLASLNGAICCTCAEGTPSLLIGTLVNATAVAGALKTQLETYGGHITVLACGERWHTPHEEGVLRFAIEDYLGAGAILDALGGEMSPEAAVCAGAFRAAQPNLFALLRDSSSGQELCARGLEGDVRIAADWNRYTIVPILQNQEFIPFSPSLGTHCATKEGT